MTTQELITELEQMNPNSEIRFACQPAWPFEYSVDGVVPVGDNEEDEEFSSEIIYLVEGRQIGYLPEEVRNEIGW